MAAAPSPADHPHNGLDAPDGPVQRTKVLLLGLRRCVPGCLSTLLALTRRRKSGQDVDSRGPIQPTTPETDVLSRDDDAYREAPSRVSRLGIERARGH
jgi:hypothetical protein